MHCESIWRHLYGADADLDPSVADFRQPALFVTSDSAEGTDRFFSSARPGDFLFLFSIALGRSAVAASRRSGEAA
jgi:hypothetical protein